MLLVVMLCLAHKIPDRLSRPSTCVISGTSNWLLTHTRVPPLCALRSRRSCGLGGWRAHGSVRQAYLLPLRVLHWTAAARPGRPLRRGQMSLARRPLAPSVSSATAKETPIEAAIKACATQSEPHMRLARRRRRSEPERSSATTTLGEARVADRAAQGACRTWGTSAAV